ncbi:KRAB-A domain-containing protein 2-like [Penaeus monodon]|uniref:KRAB-A domain-containing protein 2-like n=1 Tax=Penaeus monodon TaxID=6687 RepID=UPI0018A7B26E|nr:KRAB-A domain-containing protein 2-like [Penaeus monodon]
MWCHGKAYKKRTNADEPPLHYVTIEETLDVIKCAHVATGHGGRDRMIKELQQKYASITTKALDVKCAHVATGHGGRDRMIKELQQKYASITTKALELFKSLCEECQKKRKRPMTKGVVVHPILSKEFVSRGQVDLIDM